mmetsp:Transcript_19634/g.47586  ORF Transcript_19634/g.47586 Transcript_19634/m.47586 type:complete len:193 (+) Transcript_19634:235-813(+)
MPSPLAATSPAGNGTYSSLAASGVTDPSALSPHVEVREERFYGDGGEEGQMRGVFAKKHISTGDVVLVGVAETIDEKRTMHSIQLSEVPPRHADMYAPGRFLNHSCEPNTWAKRNSYGAYTFIARRDISKDEQIFFDYETTEYAIMAMDECFCGEPTCRKMLAGFHKNGRTILDKYQHEVADYLLDHVQPDS